MTGRSVGGRRLVDAIAKVVVPRPVGGDVTAGHQRAIDDTTRAVNALIDREAAIAVRVDTGTTDYGPRHRLNLIAGANVTITAVDDVTDGEVDITFAASGGGGGDEDWGTVP